MVKYLKNQISDCTFWKEELCVERKVKEDRRNSKELSFLFALSESLVGKKKKKNYFVMWLKEEISDKTPTLTHRQKECSS